MQLRYFFCFLCCFILFSSNAGEIIFPNLVIKGQTTNFTVVSDVELNSILINGQDISLSAGESNGSFVGKVLLEDTEIQHEESHILKSKPFIIDGWLTILPPLIAIILALIFKEVIASLFIGIFIGAMIIGVSANGISGVFSGLLMVVDTYIFNAIKDEGHVAVILFSILIGSIVAVISKNGGMQGVVNKLIRFATSKKSGMFTTYFLGLAIFFDDYANTLVVGNTMRPITDKLKISREKLAYIVDSTAAPIAAIAFITTWIGAELTYISDGVHKIELEGGVINESAYGIFMNSLAYSFYPIFTLFFVFYLIWKGKDYGPMLTAEKQIKLKKEDLQDVSANDEMDEFKPVDESKSRAFNAIIPVFIVISGTFLGLLFTGLDAYRTSMELDTLSLVQVWEQMSSMDSQENGFFKKLGLVIGNADSYTSLLWASMLGLIVAVLLTLIQSIMTLTKVMDTVVFGIKSMMSAVVILILAWSLAGVTEDLNTAVYLKTFFSDSFEYLWVLPALTFVLSAFIAFSTGSSWSTMALMYPLVIPLSFSLASNVAGYDEMSLLYNTIASVLAGAVLGDHCSPISDTTILSSLATSCDHIQHVRTQMPYALTVGAVALFIGIIPAAMGVSSYVLFPLGFLAIIGIIYWLGKTGD